jgi:hypothetical protein
MERGLYPIQVARWLQAADDANAPSLQSKADQRERQRKNQEPIRRNRQLDRELQTNKKKHRQKRQRC